MKTYPSLYNITKKKNVTVASVLRIVPLINITGVHRENLLQLVESLITFEQNDQDDVFVWNNNKNGQFIVQSMYRDMLKEGGLPLI
jgi:hypothetical protein